MRPDCVQVTNEDKRTAVRFNCDSVFSPDVATPEVFSDCGVSELVARALQGYSSTVFAYGQTGSGKTFTMFGSDAASGLVLLGLSELFRLIASHSSELAQFRFSVSVAICEVYNEQVFDLLALESDRVPLHVRLDPRNGKFFVQGVPYHDCVAGLLRLCQCVCVCVCA